MNAKVNIFCKEFDDVVFVPQEAVFKKDDKKVCYVWDDNEPREREVQAGARNDDFVVIKEGVKEGDRVYLYDPFLKR
jgi:multidrug efflux pump subunit AcrA (membrane-fusion protein)